MSTSTELITWNHLPEAGFPDSDTTVLVALEGADEPTWFGYWDTESLCWRDAATGGTFTSRVTKWADMPTAGSTL
ncbi:hypothetical protein [Paucibacter sp. Y2R2-4]|uniref:hypothetical protein n=1 Tax=Paucibacter sp. Y2R2-4 TaxID=2893553 RepID=UPI0021E4C930|nr:hypothetical protein [Paucibacter sp. Y2R2-4]MCV2349308.1 hypothetical protein [Paucibacter sp. Y2R2-4]